MIKTTLKSNTAFYIFVSFSTILVLTCVFTPQLLIFKKLSNYTVHIMLGYLGFGLFCLLIDAKRLLLTSFAISGILALFLKTTSNQNLKLAINTGAPSLSLAHINLGSSALEYDALINLLIDVNPDIITFNEATPDWDYYLEKNLRKVYRYAFKNIRVDLLGSAVYSRLPLQSSDTISNTKNPHLHVTVNIGLNQRAHILTSYFPPPLTKQAYGDTRASLVTLSQVIREVAAPTICVGDFNLADWSNELREFKTMGGLTSSRRDIIPNGNKGFKSFFNFPVDHIFYSQGLECEKFRTLQDSLGNHLGVYGSYQLKI